MLFLGGVMPFILRPYRRFPDVIPVTYENGIQEGQGTVWNLSSSGWRMSGTLPLQCGDVCSFRVTLPTRNRVSIAAGIVRWVRGEDYGIETLVIDRREEARLGKYIRERMKEL